MEKTVRSVRILLILGLIAYAARLAFNTTLARILPASLYGDFTIAWRLIGIVSILCVLGTDSSAKRFLGRYFTRQKWGHHRSFMQWNLRWVAMPMLISFIISLIAFIVMFALHMTNIKLFHTHYPAIYVLLIAPLAASSNLLCAYLVAHHRPAASYIMRRIMKFILLLVLLLFFIKTLHVTFHLVGLMSIVAVVYAVIILGALSFWLPTMPSGHLAKKIRLTPHMTDRLVTQWGSSSLKLIVNNLMLELIVALDVILLAISGRVPAQVGYYTAVVTLADILITVPTAIYTHFSAHAHKVIESKSLGQLQTLIDHCNLVGLGVPIVITIGIWIFAEPLLLLFGPHYVVGEVSLYITTVAFLVAFCARPCAIIELFLGREYVLIRTSIYELIILVVLGLIFSYYWGMVGMACATLIAAFFKTLILLVHVKMHIKIRPLSII